MRKRSLFGLSIGFLAVAALAATLAVALEWYRRPLPLPRNPYDFDVPAGATLGRVARALNADGVLPHPEALVWLARWRGADRSIKAGSYEIEPGITLARLLAKLTQGDVTQIVVTIVDGITFAQLEGELRADARLAHTLDGLSNATILARIGASQASPEGLFFPDTYFMPAGTSDLALLKRAHRALVRRLDAAWNERAPGLPLATPYEALILASIVDKETGRRSDRPLIASVFINRLRHGMRLQTDPSVIYGLGPTFDGDLKKHDLESDTPYNTYTRDGLPPTPIALPSQASIDAVLDPPQTSYLYFVARGDGSSEFSETLVAHNHAVSKYQKARR